MLKINAVPCFDDNYIWVLHDGRAAIAVDPGAAAPLTAFLAQEGLSLSAILLTHRHHDHVGGVAELNAAGTLPVYGPHGVAGVTHPLADQDRLQLLGASFSVMAIPGHTREHLAYRVNDALFCGDTLFGCGCGRVFDDTWAEMFDSLQKIAALPDETLLYPAHEYTAANLRFARAVEPDNPALNTYEAEVVRRREQGQPSLPSTLKAEKTCNPFLRCSTPAIIASALAHEAQSTSPEAVFCALRRWKDRFR